jgi:transcriptional regulator with XRE-family HTH domain
VNILYLFLMDEKIQYNRIGPVMVEKGVRNKELADYLGVTEHTVSRWRTNDQQPSIEMLNRIANYLHVDVRILMVPNELPPVPLRKK